MDFSKLNLSIPNHLTTPALHPSILPNLKNENLAESFYDRLKTYIIEFEKGLNEAEEVGAKLVTFGQNITFHIDNIGYWNPSLITFSGFTEDGKAIKLVQHVTQISVLLMALPRTNPDRERLGYKLEHEK